MIRRPNNGYILLESLVAMGILSVGVVVIQNALQQGLITRGQSQDYTQARFALERIVADRGPQNVESLGVQLFRQAPTSHH